MSFNILSSNQHRGFGPTSTPKTNPKNQNTNPKPRPKGRGGSVRVENSKRASEIPSVPVTNHWPCIMFHVQKGVPPPPNGLSMPINCSFIQSCIMFHALWHTYMSLSHVLNTFVLGCSQLFPVSPNMEQI